MKYQLTVMCLFAIAATGILMPFWINVMNSVSWFQPIRSDGPKTHQSKAGTPSMGGLVFWLVWIVISFGSTHAPNGLTLGLFYLTSGFFALGLLDDMLKIYNKNSYALGAKPKFILQCLIAMAGFIIISRMGWYQTLMHQPLPYIGWVTLPMWVGVPLWVLVMVGSSNAVNLLDGLDGLATGVVSTILVGLIACNARFVTSELNDIMLILLGTLTGFLWFNHKPARIMMGDCGSLFLGSALGYMAFVCKIMLPFVVMSAVLIATTLSVVTQVIYFKRTGKRIFKMAPLHHHFELLGMSEMSIVIRFWIVSGVFVILGYLCQQIIG